MAGERSRLPVAALGFAAAAAFSSWNPLAAPFGVVVGLGALVLSLRALRRPERRAVSIGALVLSLGAIAAGALVLALTAGVGRELGGMPVVPLPGRGAVDAELDAAAERTRPARDRARSELDTLERQEGGQEGERRDESR